MCSYVDHTKTCTLMEGNPRTTVFYDVWINCNASYFFKSLSASMPPKNFLHLIAKDQVDQLTFLTFEASLMANENA